MRFFLLISLVSINSYAMFSSDICVTGEFVAQTQRQGAFWGAFKREFKVSKSRCKVVIKHDDVISSEWEIDICKEPINLKVEQYFTKKHYIKEEICTKKSKSTFCRKVYELSALINKEGLVLAEGERDSLETEHGKIYCLSLILEKYLMKGDVFSMNHSQKVALFNDEVSINRSKTTAKDTAATHKEIKSAPVKKELQGLKKTVKEVTQKSKIEVPKKPIRPAKLEVDKSPEGEKLDSF